MEFKDYYKILGVSPDADENAIKTTYRKLARQLHPDVNPGDKEAGEKFKEVNEAYQVLSNPEQRKKYDELRSEYQRYQQQGGRPQEFNWNQWQAQQGQGPQAQYATPEDLEDLFGGAGGYSDFFSDLFGGGRGRAGPPRPRRGRDLDFEIEVPLKDAYHGAKRILQMDSRRIEARIPAGVRTGSRVRLAGQGEPGVNGGPPGDLYLVTLVPDDPSFEREGDDLIAEVPVDIYTAVLGGEVRVPTLDRPVMLKIPPQTQADRTFRLRGKGMPRLEDPKQHGDLLARVRLVLP
ncbi:MAG: DnaJ C-terminal domain-containing protein, partial [Rudaea sp.]